MKRAAGLLAAAATLILSGCPTASGLKLNGSGSSFVYPMMSKWAATYGGARGVRIDYSSTGSGAGIQQVLEKKNDFGCTDAFMSEKQLAEAKAKGGEVLHVPLAMGGVVPIFNLDGVSDLKFTGDILADIYLGKITRWDDARLKEINPEAKLPAQDIAVVYRSDGSGTTFIFSDFLSKVSEDWKKGPGQGTSLKWPVGIGAEKSDGMSGQVSRTPGAIGYVELLYALKAQDLKFGAVKNPSGEFVKASLESVTAAAEASLKDIPDDLRYSITNAPGQKAYPIAGTVWAVLFATQPPDKSKALQEFLHWVTHEGQEHCAELHYSRLPPGLVERVEKKLEAIK